MKLFYPILFILTFINVSKASETNAEKLIELETFLKEHSVSSTKVYCRSDIKAPECRMLIRYSNNQTKQQVKSFQIAFVAPVRQAGGTEYFLKNENDSTFTRFADSTVDTKVNPTIEELSQEVLFTHNSITIKNIKFGSLVADLSFNGHLSEVNGLKDGQAVILKYDILK